MKHTPTPWAWCDNNTCLYGNDKPEQGTQDCVLHCEPINSPDDEDAAFIVKAVNSHEDMVDILKRVERLPIFLEGNDNALHCLIKMAIEKAEAI